MTNESNLWIKRAIVKQRVEFGTCCAYCGVTFEENKKLEFAHLEKDELNGTGRGRKERYYHRKRNKVNYTLLCPDHHQEYDDGKLKRAEVDIWGGK